MFTVYSYTPDHDYDDCYGCGYVYDYDYDNVLLVPPIMVIMMIMMQMSGGLRFTVYSYKSGSYHHHNYE